MKKDKQFLTDTFKWYTTKDKMPDWQPIETAPKDETSILGYHPKEEGTITTMRYSNCRKAWINDEYDAIKYNPTHWMPLPHPPLNKKICFGALWESIHDKNGIYAKCVDVEMGYRDVTYCPVCGGKHE